MVLTRTPIRGFGLPGVDGRRELYEAMLLIARTGKGPEDQIQSMGCSINWRE